MTATIPNLWPDDIKVDVLPPLVILRAQASKIHQLTKGVLLGEVTSTEDSDGFVTHRLDLIAPALDNRRARILSVTHREGFYPVVIEAECFRPKAPPRPRSRPAGEVTSRFFGSSEWPDPKDWRPIGGGQDEFIRRVGEVLKSKEVRAVIDSLLALSNEKNQPAEEPAA
jgi:hypothetical protein